MKRLPVYLLTGFLGSGKTTLLQKLLGYCREQSLKVGLLVNDFGAVNVDALLVGAAQRGNEQITMMQLSGGCACCTVSRELVVDILEMTMAYELDLIIIEASGVADALDLLDQLTMPGLLRRIYPAAVVSVVDGLRFYDLAQTMPLVQRQVQYADLLIFNKCDLLVGDIYDKALAELQKLNPHATIHPTSYAEIDPSLIFERITSNVVPQEQAKHNHMTFHAWEHALTKPFDRLSFEALLLRMPLQIIRAKGFVRFFGESALYLLQYVAGQYAFTCLEDSNEIQPKLVFIGQNLNLEELKRSLQECEA
ncbi:MAG: GTP-binding protein [Chloroflexi bacterium]|uniref:GTP-binding protein n=1 Tax=Candidatus Chlorohelix allophototropha TaxID=3003348 RepID=A0A8T7M081_9CHLR|nr:GTP-binding protein [Chloroflexota bacterium]WJW67174.1 GTP-binding protein [Chloroflexota bacterium L227-S17]